MSKSQLGRSAYLYEIDLSNKISSVLCILDHVFEEVPD